MLPFAALCCMKGAGFKKRRNRNDKNTFRLPRQHLPQPDGGALCCAIWSKRRGRAGRIFHPFGRDLPTRRSAIDGTIRRCAAPARGGGNLLCGKARRAAHARADYAAYDLLIGMERSASARDAAPVRRRPGGEAAPAGGLHRPSAWSIADPWYTRRLRGDGRARHPLAAARDCWPHSPKTYPARAKRARRRSAAPPARRRWAGLVEGRTVAAIPVAG